MSTQKTKLKFRSSWDDGDPLDYKIGQLLLQYRLPGIFYIPSCTQLEEPAIKLLAKNGFEIGGHTVSHPSDMKLLTEEQIELEVLENKIWLELIIGKPITKFCYPRGRYDDRVIKALQIAGFLEARTTVVMETKSRDPYKTDTAVHVYQRKEYNNIDWFEIACGMVAQAVALDGVFHIWGHSWEIERDGNWQKLEMFFDWLTENYEIINI